ncbi:hypothetical protein [Spirosoma luteum]|uniref:hypothetical protein n=1 Tax=Spirosoma luteum TaxID=431553 RepID=UPI00037BEB2A|nr:hypothetical protein [Spirosoma luteum]
MQPTNKLTRKAIRLFSTLFGCFVSFVSYAQIDLHTEDLPRFYEAFDSVLTTSDTAKQLRFIQQLYVDKASTGLKEFMVLRGGNTQKWRKYIESNKADLVKKRPQILSVLNQKPEILKKVAVLKKLYPDFRYGNIYFCVGIGNSGGTIRDRTVYIGTEVAANAQPDWSVYLVIHEFVHTQQYEQRNFNRLMSDTTLVSQYEKTHENLLGQCLKEGMADFVTELVLGQRLDQLKPDGYIAFGLQHEQPIWEAFRKEMNQPINWEGGWLYNVRKIEGKEARDLGYFVGYQICKRYYEKARDKKKALAYMIGLDLTDKNSEKFLAASGYNPE